MAGYNDLLLEFGAVRKGLEDNTLAVGELSARLEGYGTRLNDHIELHRAEAVRIGERAQDIAEARREGSKTRRISWKGTLVTAAASIMGSTVVQHFINRPPT